ncbi:MAG: trigger factor [Desulfuromonadaceae bacterium]|nr:trigger factor [Desulfuromonadaceae bacterium]MDD2849208.1 trigger factor [Desulfuromonadaceae bacterium]MDD4129743.1 trigger factor [Desulfuromonadaceae bacterium]
MQIHVEDISSVQKKITIEIPVERVNEEIDKAYSAIQKKAKLQGFRPGKAPMQLIKRTYSDAMRDDVMRRLYQQTLYKAMDEHKVEPIDSPVIESDILEPGVPFKYSAIFEVMPQILLNEYTGLTVNKEIYVSKPESIDAELKRMQENMAQLIPLDEGVAIENGHTVSVDYSIGVVGSPEENSGAQTAEVEVGSGSMIPGFEEQLLGLKAGDSKEFTLDLPTAGEDVELNEMKGIFSVTVKEIKRKELPKLDDEFAQQFGEYDTMEDLRAKMVEYHEKHELDRIENELKERVIQALIAKNPLDVPESMVKRQLEHMLENLKNRLKSQQMSLEMMGLDTESFSARFRDDAIDKVKGGLLLMALVEKENISVSDDDLSAHYEKIAAGNQEMLDRIKAYYTSNQNAKSSIISEIKEDKAISYLIDHAVVTEVEAEQLKAA